MRIAIAAAPRARAKAEAGTPGSLDLTGDGGPFRSGGRRREGARGIGDLGFRGRAASRRPPIPSSHTSGSPESPPPLLGFRLVFVRIRVEVCFLRVLR